MCGCKCCISAKSVHLSLLSWCDLYFKNSSIKAKILKTEGLGKNQISFMKHIKIRPCQMGVILTPKHLICKVQQYVRIHSQILHYHTGNVSFNVVPNVHGLVFLTKKQIINIPTLVLQFDFIFII